MNLTGHSLLLPDEQVFSEITGPFELQEMTGVNYKFGTFIATDKRLIWQTKDPLGLKETTVYQYRDLFNVDAAQSLFTFTNDVSIKVKLINKGDKKHFLDTVQHFSMYSPGIRNFHKKDSGE
jgi:Bacterial PH domain